MLFRPIGTTGMSASIIGLGAEHLDHQPYEVCEEVIDAALENGINIIDVFMPGTPVRDNISRALKGRRDQVLLQGHIGSVDVDDQYDRTRDVPTCKRYFENFLRSFETDYVDLGMMFFIETEDDFRGVFETDYINYVQQLKQDGTIRAIGASSHNAATAARVVETGVIDLLMFSVNPAFDMMPADADVFSFFEAEPNRDNYLAIDPGRAALYTLCANRGVAITTMKTYAAGKLLTPEFSPFAAPLSAIQCIHYALTRPAVVSTLIGCKTRGEVLEAVSYLSKSDEERDFSEAIRNVKSDLAAACVYCNHCLPCPAGIDIAAMNRLSDVASLNGSDIPQWVRSQYEASAAKAADCIECGSCESRCPFGVQVIEKMRRTSELFR